MSFTLPHRPFARAGLATAAPGRPQLSARRLRRSGPRCRLSNDPLPRQHASRTRCSLIAGSSCCRRNLSTPSGARYCQRTLFPGGPSFGSPVGPARCCLTARALVAIFFAPQQVLQELHTTPAAKRPCPAIARRAVWWPALPADLETLIRSCPTCQRRVTPDPHRHQFSAGPQCVSALTCCGPGVSRIHVQHSDGVRRRGELHLQFSGTSASRTSSCRTATHASSSQPDSGPACTRRSAPRSHLALCAITMQPARPDVRSSLRDALRSFAREGGPIVRHSPS
jgi:hypothetical protein